jgi:hypothetical protein
MFQIAVGVSSLRRVLSNSPYPLAICAARNVRKVSIDPAQSGTAV